MGDLNIAMVPAAGVEADLSHIEGKCKVSSCVLTLNEHKAIDKAGAALTGCNLVLVPAGVPRKPGQDRKDLLTINADIDKAGAALTGCNLVLVPLDTRVQDAGTEVVKAKNGKGSATLSMAYSGARLGRAVLSGLAGVPTTECAYVESSVCPGLPYFSSKVVFGKGGVQDVLPMGNLSAHEQGRLEELKPILMGEIQDGLDYAKTREFGK